MDIRLFNEVSRDIFSHDTLKEGGAYTGFTKQVFLWTGVLVAKCGVGFLLKQENGVLLYFRKGKDYDNGRVFITSRGRTSFYLTSLRPVQPKGELVGAAEEVMAALQLKQTDIDRKNFQASVYFEKCPHGWTRTFYQARQKDRIPRVTVGDEGRFLLPNQAQAENKRILFIVLLLRQVGRFCERCS